WYDKPEDSQDEPELAFFDALPTVWDDSKVLSGRPGESVVMARKQGDRWFVGGITNTEARKLDVDFSFLDPEKQYNATIYTDGGKAIKTRTQVKVSSRKNMKQGDQLAFDVLPSGGFTMVLTPIND
ncbi:MAG: glycoside hydrolase family 97 C-terminal domain-containing protein, partial [Tannerellaceae bacterium]